MHSGDPPRMRPMNDIAYIVLQFFAAGVLLLGLYLMGNLKKLGPFLAGLSEIIWVGVFIPPHLWGGIFLSTILFVMQARNFIKWHREGLPWI
jgi:hypothetical protein